LARRILLADDSVTAQNMGRRILSDAGYEVITVNNGSAALKKVSEQAPDVIVLDVYMPGYGGLEVCQRLKEVAETARIPILLTVGKLEPFKPDEARRVRADAFIVKPFEASELLAALTKLEDRIVPASAPGKSGKVRSIGDAARSEEETGWKNRLIIPPGGKGRSPEGLEADDFGQAEDFKSKKPAVVEKAETEKTEASAAVASEAKEVAKAEEKSVSTDIAAVAEVKEVKTEAQPVPAVSAPEVAAAESKVIELKKESAPAAEPESKNVAPVIEIKTEAVAVSDKEKAREEAPSYSGPRWVAEEVQLSEQDSAFALDQEMQKSLAASVAYEAGQKASAEAKSEKEESKVEVVSRDDSADKIKPAETSSVAELPVAAPPIGTSTEEEQPAVVKEVANTEVALQPKGEAFAAAASAGTGATDAVAPEPQAPAVGQTDKTADTTQPDSGNKQQLAAAWEQWQNVRETVLNSPVAEQITEAAAASLKNALPAESSTNKDIEASPSPSNPTAIANIVDSVLAELKPKLVEEIAKKLGKDKK
jgi:twitching motility two-component system response regulator PilH